MWPKVQSPQIKLVLTAKPSDHLFWLKDFVACKETLANLFLVHSYTV